MHLIRRSAFRAINSPSTSLLSKSRSITTSSPFIARTKPQATIFPIFRRFASNDVQTETRESETETTPSSADKENQSSIGSAISPAAAKDAGVDTPLGGASAAGLAFKPREDRREYRPRNDYGSDRRSAAPEGRYGERRRDFADPPHVTPSNSLYVGNLLFEIREEDLEREFSQFGKIEDINIAKDARNLSKGFGYIRFESIDAATAAMQAKNQTVMDGRRLVVNYQFKTSRPQGSNPPSKTLFIGNLAFEMSDADLNKLFRDIKNVMDVRVAIDRRTGQPRGFAHADFVDVESAMKGLEYLQGKEFYGRVLRVDYASSSKKSEGQSPPDKY